MIRPAIPDDLDVLCSMARRFVGETDLPLMFSKENTRESLWRAIHQSTVLVWEGDKVLGGTIIGDLESDFTVEKLAYVTKFYVEKEFRGLGVSRELIQGFEDEMKRLGAKVICASSTAGMGPRVEALYVRLFERQGYNVLGRVLIKEI